MSGNRVLVTGATGKIGEHLVQLLLEKNVATTILARDVAKTTKAFPKATVVAGDLSKVESVEEVLKTGAFDRLFLLSYVNHVEAPICAAAKRHNIKQVVKISCLDASIGEETNSFFQTHGAAEVDIQRTGVPFVFLRPHDFQQNMLSHAASIKAAGKIYGAHPGAHLSSIDTRDIALCAASILTDDPAKHNGRCYTLTGPEALSPVEVAHIASEVLGKPIEYVDVGDAGAYQAMVSHSLPPYVAFGLIQLSQHYRKLYTSVKWHTGSVELITGKKPHGWRSFFVDHKALFQ